MASLIDVTAPREKGAAGERCPLPRVSTGGAIAYLRAPATPRNVADRTETRIAPCPPGSRAAAGGGAIKMGRLADMDDALIADTVTREYGVDRALVGGLVASSAERSCPMGSGCHAQATSLA